MDGRWEAFSLMQDIAKLRGELFAIAAELKFRRFVRAFKANFNRAQLRDERGRWTLPGTGHVADINPETGTGEIETQADDSFVAIDYSNALTGNVAIDDTTRALSEILGRTIADWDIIPEQSPTQYGTAVHVAFGTAVRLGDLPGIAPEDVEQSFMDESVARPGGRGTIRTDVVVRNEAGEIIAIYDVKTGRAGLNSARVREIRAHTGASEHIPVIELSTIRGASLKARLVRRLIGKISAVLWDPMHHRDNADRVAIARASGSRQ